MSSITRKYNVLVRKWFSLLLIKGSALGSIYIPFLIPSHLINFQTLLYTLYKGISNWYRVTQQIDPQSSKSNYKHLCTNQDSIQKKKKKGLYCFSILTVCKNVQQVQQTKLSKLATFIFSANMTIKQRSIFLCHDCCPITKAFTTNQLIQLTNQPLTNKEGG